VAPTTATTGEQGNEDGDRGEEEKAEGYGVDDRGGQRFGGRGRRI